VHVASYNTSAPAIIPMITGTGAITAFDIQGDTWFPELAALLAAAAALLATELKLAFALDTALPLPVNVAIAEDTLAETIMHSY
jgi:hypothetical protein